MTMPKPLLPHHRRHYPPALLNLEWRQSNMQKRQHAYYVGVAFQRAICGNGALKAKELAAWHGPKSRCRHCRRLIKEFQDRENRQVAEHFSDLEFRAGAM